eukprot:276394_1
MASNMYYKPQTSKLKCILSNDHMANSNLSEEEIVLYKKIDFRKNLPKKLLISKQLLAINPNNAHIRNYYAIYLFMNDCQKYQKNVNQAIRQLQLAYAAQYDLEILMNLAMFSMNKLDFSQAKSDKHMAIKYFKILFEKVSANVCCNCIKESADLMQLCKFKLDRLSDIYTLYARAMLGKIWYKPMKALKYLVKSTKLLPCHKCFRGTSTVTNFSFLLGTHFEIAQIYYEIGKQAKAFKQIKIFPLQSITQHFVDVYTMITMELGLYT